MKRNLTMDLLKFSLALMVVGIHCAFLAEYNSTVSYLFVNGLFRIAVPIFFIVNGYYFQKTISSSSKTKQHNWFKKIILLYVFWSFIYAVIWLRLDSITILSILRVLKDIFFGQGHLWYLPATIFSAIMVLILSKKKVGHIISLSLILYIIGIVISYVGRYELVESNLISKFLLSSVAVKNFPFFGFPFFYIGFFISKYINVDKLSNATIILMFFAGLASLLSESFYNFKHVGSAVYFDVLISLLLICPSIFLFCLKLNLASKNKILATLSTGVYLVHVLIMEFFREFYYFSETYLTLIVAIISILITVALSFVNKKVKWIL